MEYYCSASKTFCASTYFACPGDSYCSQGKCIARASNRLPSVYLISPSNNSVSSQSVAFKIQASDDTSANLSCGIGAHYSFNGSVAQEFSNSTVFNNSYWEVSGVLSYGDYKWKASCSDGEYENETSYYYFSYPAPTATPAPTPNATAEPTSSPAPTLSPQPNETATPTPTVQATQTPTATPTLPVNLSFTPTPVANSPALNTINTISGKSCPVSEYSRYYEEICKTVGDDYGVDYSSGCPVYKCLESIFEGESSTGNSLGIENESQKESKAKLALILEDRPADVLTGEKSVAGFIRMVRIGTLGNESIDPFSKNKLGGVFNSTNPLESISCQPREEGASVCECNFEKELYSSDFSNSSYNITAFSCVVSPGKKLVNGNYSLTVADVYGASNGGRDVFYLEPGVPNIGVYREPAAASWDSLYALIAGIALISTALYTLNYFKKKVEAREARRNQYSAKKAQVENDFKMLKYRFLKRELDEVSFRRLWDEKQKEYSEVKTRLLEEEEKLKKKS